MNRKNLKNVGAFAPSARPTSKARQNKGITLIALIITIIVMLILVAVTINMSINGGLFEQAGKSKFVTEVSSIKEELTRKTIMAEMVDEEIEDNAIDTVLGKKTGYNDKLLVQNGELVYDKDKVTETQKTWLEEMGIQAKKPTVKDLILEGKIKVGDYVNYTPDTGTYKVASGETGSGYTSEQSFTTEVDNEEAGTSALKWRILSINEETGEIELVSETAAQSSTKLYLKGADGYNHAVDILNDLCETLYSKTVNGTKVATGRSMNLEDINVKTTYDYMTYTNYGTIKALSDYSTSYRKYPNLYERETGYAPAGTAQTGLNGSVGLKDGVTDSNGLTTYSTVTGYTDDYDSSTSSSKKDVRFTYTYYTYTPENYLKDLGINTAPKGLICLGTSYWVASRCTIDNSNFAGFLVRYIHSSGGVNGEWLLYASASSMGDSYAVRPVVTLRFNVSLTKNTENSNESVTYWNIEF